MTKRVQLQHICLGTGRELARRDMRHFCTDQLRSEYTFFLSQRLALKGFMPHSLCPQIYLKKWVISSLLLSTDLGKWVTVLQQSRGLRLKKEENSRGQNKEYPLKEIWDPATAPLVLSTAREGTTSALKRQGFPWTARNRVLQKPGQLQPCFLQAHPACSAQGSQWELLVFSRIRPSVWTWVAKKL